MKLSLPDLRGLPVMLSASLPQNLVGTSRAQELLDIIVAMVGGVLSANGTLVFGGHPSVTPLVHRVARSFSFKDPKVRLFQLRRFQKDLPNEVYDDGVFGKVVWVGSESDDTSDREKDLAEMREEMAKVSRAAIFLGGKTEQNYGRIPGIRDEYQRFINHHKEGPAYLLGGLGGEALRIIQSLEERGNREPNGLSDDEIADVRYSDDMDFAASIVITDIRRHATSTSENSVTEDREERIADEVLINSLTRPPVFSRAPEVLTAPLEEIVNWSPRVLIISLDRDFADAVAAVVREERFLVDQTSANHAAEMLRQVDPQLIIFDLSEEIQGWAEQFLRYVREESPSAEIIVTAGPLTPNYVTQLLKMGVTGFFSKPFSREDLIRSVHAAAARLHKSSRYKAQLRRVSDQLLNPPSALPSLARLDAIAKSDSTVLITGGTDVGNKMLARLIHNKSSRASKPWAMVNCAALPETMLEDKMFGHVAGAYTAAMSDTTGGWQEAEGGTIFLRNISAISITLQSKLLQALQTREIRRIGSAYAQKVNVRVIADTPHPLLQDVEQGRFREDLFYRLGVMTIDLPHHELNEPDFKIIEAQAEVERLIVESALRFADGDSRGAARLLGVPRSLLYARLKGLRHVTLRPTTRDK
jgi:DNA-binding NtrC family response regulator